MPPAASLAVFSLEQFGDSLTPIQDLPLVGPLTAVVGLLAIAICLACYLRQRRSRQPNNGCAYRWVTRFLGLHVADRLLLAHVARQQHLPTPLTLLLSASTLRHYGRIYLRECWPGWRHGVAQRLERIAKRVEAVAAA